MQACTSRWEGCAGITVEYSVTSESTIQTTQLCTAKTQQVQTSGDLVSSWEYVSSNPTVSSGQAAGEAADCIEHTSNLVCDAGKQVSLAADDELYNAVALEGLAWDDLCTTFTKNIALIKGKVVWVDITMRFVMFKCTSASSPHFNRWVVGHFRNLPEYADGTSCSAVCWKGNTDSLTASTSSMWIQLTDFPDFKLNDTVVSDVKAVFYQRGAPWRHASTLRLQCTGPVLQDQSQCYKEQLFAAGFDYCSNQENILDRKLVRGITQNKCARCLSDS